MQICPHCETTLSNFEVAQGYKDIKDISVYVKFKVTGNPVIPAKAGTLSNDNGKNQKAINKIEGGDTYFLAWTTTPWTLPGNVALAVGKDIDYVKVKVTGNPVIPAKAGIQGQTTDIERGDTLDSRVRGNDKKSFLTDFQSQFGSNL